jgi:hypothetical protein
MKTRTEPFNFLESMAARGVMPCPRHGCRADSRFYYRQNGNEIQVAVIADFDRWANSVDFVFSIPKTEKALRKTLARLDVVAARKADPLECGKELRI